MVCYGIFWSGPTWRAVLKLSAMQLYISDGIELAEASAGDAYKKNKTQPVREVPLATWIMLTLVEIQYI